jgi:multidrug resistance efflux pump
MPDDLAEDLIRTLNEMRSQNDALSAKDDEQTAMRKQFQADIDRYKQLRSARATR